KIIRAWTFTLRRRTMTFGLHRMAVRPGQRTGVARVSSLTFRVPITHPTKPSLLGFRVLGAAILCLTSCLRINKGFRIHPMTMATHVYSNRANAGSTFVLSTDTGASWNSRYFFSEEVRDLSQITGPTDDPVVYTPKKSAGTTPDGQEVVQLKRIDGVLGAGSATVS